MLLLDRFRLPWWLLGAGLLVGYQSAGSQSIYDTPEDLFSYVAIVVALMNMFLVGRHTRADEESGRAELIRSARVGRHAPLARRPGPVLAVPDRVGPADLPYAGDRWWPLLLGLAVTALLVAVALLDRRDFGAGLRPSRPGRASASRALGSPLGLAWRLQRGSVIGWAIGLFLLGAAYGSFADSFDDFVADYPEIAEYLGGAANVVNSGLALTMLMCALLTAAFGVASAMRARAEETSGRVELVLATATSRSVWLASHLSVALVPSVALGSALVLMAAGFGHGLAYGLTIADAGQISRLIGVVLVYLPAVWLVIALAVVGLGWLPRIAAVLAWVAVGYCAIVALFGDSFELPAWFQNASPFTHTPEAPFEAVTAAPLLTIAAIVVLLLVGGFTGFRRRDLGY